MMNKKGFTLIEMAIVLLISATSMGAFYEQSFTTGHMQEAYQIGQGQLETLEAAGYNAISNGTATVTGSSGVAYSVNWTATTVGQLKKVSLSVQWSDSAVAMHAFNLKAQFSQ